MNTPLMKAQGKEFQRVESNSQHVFNSGVKRHLLVNDVTLAMERLVFKL